MPLASVIIAFYNRPDVLDLTLAGLNRQSEKNFEIIIADDGSGDKVADYILRLSKRSEIPMKHLWQEDRGFRKNRILNRAVVDADSEYLIFIDMDCIPHSEFVREHIRNREAGRCLTGRRVNLSAKISSRLTPARVENGFLETNMPFLVCDGIFGSSRDVEKGFYIRSAAIRRIMNRRYRGLLGCNFSLYKKDLVAINGFDERYEQPSVGEDSDVEFRLGLMGIRVKSMNYMAVQYHLFHPPSARPGENLELFASVKAEGKAYTEFGINRKDWTDA